MMVPSLQRFAKHNLTAPVFLQVCLNTPAMLLSVVLSIFLYFCAFSFFSICDGKICEKAEKDDFEQ